MDFQKVKLNDCEKVHNFFILSPSDPTPAEENILFFKCEMQM